MSQDKKALLAGAATFMLGLLLWLFAGDIDVPVFELPKVGLVLMVLGVAEACYGLYLAVRRPGAAKR